MKSQEVTDSIFEARVLQAEGPVLVEFGADWCRPCRAMAPVLDLISEELDGKAIIGKLDVDSNPEFTARFDVRNLPTFLVFKQGKMVERIVGAAPKNVLIEKISTYL